MSEVDVDSRLLSTVIPERFLHQVVPITITINNSQGVLGFAHPKIKVFNMLTELMRTNGDEPFELLANEICDFDAVRESADLQEYLCNYIKG